MLNLDTTSPAAALPAASAAAASATNRQKGATDAFGDLLTLITGHQGSRAAGTRRHAGASRAQDALTAMPFPFNRAESGSKDEAGAKRSVSGATGADAVPVTDPHAADEKALADNLTFLLAMAGAPKAEPQTADAASGTTQDTIAASSPTDEGPAKTGPHGHRPTPSSVGAGFSRTFGAGSAASPVDNTSTAAATIAATLDAANKPADSGPVPKAGTQIPPRTLAADAASGRDTAKRPDASIATTPVFITIPVGESRTSDGGGSANRDGRGADPRHPDAASASPVVSLPAVSVFQVAPESRAPLGAAAPIAEAGAAGRVEVPADADVPRQIVQAIRMQWADGVGAARITLQPEYLGELSIAIRVEHGAVTASLESNTASVREWIDNNQPMLRQALAEHGLHLDRLTVVEEQAQPDWSGNEDPRQKQQQEDARRAQRARRRGDDEAPVFEMMA